MELQLHRVPYESLQAWSSFVKKKSNFDLIKGPGAFSTCETHGKISAPVVMMKEVEGKDEEETSVVPPSCNSQTGGTVRQQ